VNKQGKASKLEQREERRRSSLVASIAGVGEPQPDEQIPDEHEHSGSSRDRPTLVVNRKGELRDRRKQFVLKVSLHDKAAAKCKEMGISMNEAVNQLLETWLKADE
jgi:hypothetical protein